MTRAYRFLLLALLLGLAASLMGVAWAQSPPTTGTPPFGSFGGGPEVINLANLNVHWDVPVLAKAGRGGFNFTYDLSYDSSVWAGGVSSGSSLWYPVGNWGWRGITEASMGYLSYTSSMHLSCEIWNPDDRRYDKYFYYLYNFNGYGDPFGIPHPLNVTLEDDETGGNCPNNPPPNIPSYATGAISDGSGYGYSLQAPALSGFEYIYPTSGGAIQPPLSRFAVAANNTDRNGNQITVNSSGQFFDTLSSTVPVLTVSGSSPMTFTYTAPSGANASYTMKYTAYTVKTNFGCPNISEYGPTSNNLVSEIDLPDGSKYTFTYEPTPGYAGDVTGRLYQVTLPTGGQITYTYSGGNNGIVCADGSTATLTRTTPDGTWTYAHSESGTAWTTLITDPQGNQTNMNFQGIYETQRQVSQLINGSQSLLRQWTTCYNGNTSNCNTTAITLPITQRTVTDQYGSGGLQCEHNYVYNSAGGLTEQDDYDYGSGGPGALLRQTLVTYASLGNNITAFQQQVTVKNGSGTVVSQTNYNYDETTPTATSGITQHTSVYGSRGNLTSINYPVSGLTSHFTYWDTGSLSSSQDVNTAATTYNYGTDNTANCQMAFPVSVSEPVGNMSRSMTWNCTGGVQLTATDENNQVTSTTFNDAYFWRPNATTDQAQNTTSIGYLQGGTAITSALSFNNNNSLAAIAHNFDGLGRPSFDQRYQSPGGQNYDTVSYTYDANGRPYSTSVPCSVGAGGNCPATPKTTQTYDALNRALVTTDGGGGTVTNTYSNNDVLVTIGPAPSGENTKRRQLEYDALGRLTSVCELSSASGSGTCGQNSPQTGYWTEYSYDALGNLLNVTQNAQAPSGGQQTRSYSFDAMSRLTSETNAENGTTTYTYDSDSTCGSSNGDVVKKLDAAGNVNCIAYDALHRPTAIKYPSGPNSANTPSKYLGYDSSSYWPQLTNTKGRLIGGHTCWEPCTALITDLTMGYTPRGEISDIYEATPNSGGYYHISAQYWANGAPSQLSGLPGLPTITYGVEGEGRINTASASSGQNPVTNVTFNSGSLPSQVNFGSGDSDIFAYDSNTLRMTQFKFNVGAQPQSYVGALTWNANGSLNQLAITDPFNGSDAQTCNYSHDDLARIGSANCGSAAAQTFSYDPFGNINKSGSPYSFNPTYSASTNRMTSIGSFTPTYDSNGNVTNDGLHTYAWDVDGNSVTVDSIGLTFDVLDRMVEQNRSGSYTQIVYDPSGAKLALMSGQSLVKAFIALPGQATAIYTSSGLDHYRHSDWLGSARLTSSPSQSYVSGVAYAPFGETYAQSGTADLSFTGQNPDTTSGNYDSLFREYSMQGRWASPDPAGLAAVDPTDPQSWNRYAYVRNMPVMLTDPSGLMQGCNLAKTYGTRPHSVSADGPFDPELTDADPDPGGGNGCGGHSAPCNYTVAGCGSDDGGGGGFFGGGGPLFFGGGFGGYSFPDFGINSFILPGIGLGADPWFALNPFGLGMPSCFPFFDNGAGNIIYAGTCGGGDSGTGGGPANNGTQQVPKVIPQPMLKFKPPSWHNFTNEFLPCYGAQLLNNFVGSDDKAGVTAGTVALTVAKPVLGGPLLVVWTSLAAFQAGSACAVASRGYYQ